MKQRSPNSYSATLWGRLCATLAVALVLTASPLGCSDDEQTGCTSADDCPGNQICQGGVCVDPSRACTGPDDCDRNEDCIANLCRPREQDAGDVVEDPVTDTPEVVRDLPVDEPVQDTVTDPDAISDPDIVFTDPPQIVSTDPADGATDVPRDGEITITFDQPMRQASFTASNVRVLDYRGEPLSRAITYNPASYSVTLSPPTAGELLDYAAPYEVILGTNISGENHQQLETSYTFAFSTAMYTAMNDYQELAEAYAPVVYAEVRAGTAQTPTHRIDWFTRLNFDGNWVTSDNRANAWPAMRTLEPHVYYNVLESPTHYLIQYVYYYPIAVNNRDHTASDAVEHDFSYSLVVVQKLDDDPLGRFVMAEGFGDLEVWGFILNSYPTGCGGEDQPPCGGVSSRQNSMIVRFDSALLEPAADGQPGRRYPVYISTGGHSNCLAGAYDPIGTNTRTPNRCRHNLAEGAPFYADNQTWSRVLRLGEASHWTLDGEAAELESNELTYTMSPFLEAFWVRRANLEVFESRRSYLPPPEGAGEADEVYILPTNLKSGYAVGDRSPPFNVQADITRTCDGCSTLGVWFVDPSWELLGHVNFDHDFSTDYCFNPFLEIDRRDEELCQ